MTHTDHQTVPERTGAPWTTGGTTPLSPRRTVVDEVPVLWDDIPGDPTATLIFGVGVRDTAPRGAGITHLVEHLVMERVGRQAARTNATSSPDSTMFYATGSEQERGQFLAAVCEAITWVRTVTDEDLDVARRTIFSEVGTGGIYSTIDPMTERYGLVDLGVMAVNHARLLDWTAAEVRWMAETWFHRDNAILTLTTMPWAGLTLELPDGRTPLRAPAPAPQLVSPAAVEHRSETVVLSGTVRGAHSTAAREVAATALVTAVTDAVRGRHGIAYDVDLASWHVGGSEIWHLVLDPQEDVVEPAVTAMLTTLDGLREAGPSQVDLDHAATSLRSRAELSSWRATALDLVASSELRGYPSPLPPVDDLGEVSVDEVRSVVDDLLSAALLLLPPGATGTGSLDAVLERGGYGPSPVMQDPEGRSPKELLSTIVWGPRGSRMRHFWAPSTFYEGKRSSPARGQSIAILPDRLVFLEPGALSTIMLDDIVLVGTDADGDVEVVGASGAVVLFGPSMFRGLPAAWERARWRMPHAEFYAKHRVPISAG